MLAVTISRHCYVSEMKYCIQLLFMKFILIYQMIFFLSSPIFLMVSLILSITYIYQVGGYILERSFPFLIPSHNPPYFLKCFHVLAFCHMPISFYLMFICQVCANCFFFFHIFVVENVYLKMIETLDCQI